MILGEMCMEINKFRELYWNYHLQIEGDFFNLEPYCAIDLTNDKAFSTKYLQLLLSTCGEIDTICKRICCCLDPNLEMDKANINDYKNILMNHDPMIAQEVVKINHHIYREIKPLQSWEHKQTPHWWSTYNKVKHHRDEVWNGKEAYKYANQKTAIEALAALYIVLEYWAAYNFVLNNEQKNAYFMLQVESQHLSMVNWNTFYTSFMGNYFFEAEKCRQFLSPEKEKEGASV